MKFFGRLLVVLIGVAILAGVFLTQTTGAGSGAPTSVLSDSSRGRQVFFETLEELGFDCRAWTQAPGELPDGGGLLWLHRVPERPPGYRDLEDAGEQRMGDEDSQADEKPPGETSRPRIAADGKRPRDPMHYLRFVAAGGVLLLPAREDLLAFLGEDLGLLPIQELELQEVESDGPLRVLLPDGEALEVSWEHDAVFVEPGLNSPFEVVLVDGGGRPLMLRYPYGSGAFLLAPPAEHFIDNGEIEEPGNALLAVRILEAHAPREVVWFDEYALGGWEPRSPLELAFSSGIWPFSVHLLLLGIVLLWGAAWVGAFPRDPVKWTPISALMRAQGFAGLMLRARRFEGLANLLRHGVLGRLVPRAARRDLALTSSADRTVAPAAELVEACLGSGLGSARLGAADQVRARALELLVHRSIRDQGDLERLGQDLRRFELAFTGAVSSGPGSQRPELSMESHE